MIDKLTQKCKEVLVAAQQNCIVHNHSVIDEEHVFLSLIDDEDSVVLLQLAGGNIAKIKMALQNQLKKLPTTQQATGEVGLSSAMQRLLNLAFKRMNENGDTFISADTLLLVIAKEGKRIKPLLKTLNLDSEKLESAFAKNRNGKTVDSDNADTAYNVLDKYTVNLSESARAGKLDPVIGRDAEIRRAINILQRRTKNNPVLIGEPGVGKTAIVEGLAQRFVNKEVSEEMASKEILVLDISTLLAGAKYRGEFEERLKLVLKEIKEADKYLVFIDELHTLIGAGRGGDGAIDAANMLKPMLARGELHCIGATTLEEYRRYIEKDPALERRFQKVVVAEPSVESSIAILRGLSGRYEAHHGVKISDPAIVAAVELSARYIADRFLPDKAIDLIDEAAARLRVEATSRPEPLDKIYRRLVQLRIEKEVLARETDSESKKNFKAINDNIKKLEKEFADMDEKWQIERQKVQRVSHWQNELERLENELAAAQRDSDWQRVAQIKHGELKEVEKAMAEQKKSSFSLIKSEIGENEIAEVVSLATGIPVANLVDDERTKIKKIESVLTQSVVGQPAAISAVADTIRRARLGLSDENKPLGVFLFLGPTGVGKTQLCKSLSAFLFNSEKNLLRIDMSEYREMHSLARLIGAPPGYVGHDEGGQLTEAIRLKPFSVVLLDEIEKAHPNVLNVLLQVFDEGRLTDGKGRTVNFKNAIVIMTSNLASDKIQSLAATGELQQHHDEIIAEVRQYFRPEFFNRLDDTIIFNPLTKEDMHDIVDIHLANLHQRLAHREWRLSIADSVKADIITDSYSPDLGARPLKRLIQTKIESPLAEWILQNEPAKGEKIIMKEDGQFALAC